MKKTALVTGASKGLGLEWCKQLAKAGYTVFLSARSQTKAMQAADSISSFGYVIPETLDVADEAQIRALAEKLASEIEHLDLLINNAGINSKDSGDQALFMKSFRLDALDANEVLRHIRINGIAPILMVKHFRQLLSNAENPRVVSISSWLGSLTKKEIPGHYGYATSKTALNMMNRAMALEVEKENITAVVVNPGWVKTDMGGESAQLTTEESVSSMLTKVVNKVELKDSGKFFNYDGTIHPW